MGKLLRLAVVVFSLSLCASIASAQLTTAEEKGLPSNSAFSGGDVDVVNLQNGNLHISIPIATVAQRGGTTLKWSYDYDTQAWIKQWHAYTCQPGPCNPPGEYLPAENTNVVSGWRLSSPFGWGVGYTNSGPITCIATNQTYQAYTNWFIGDPDGTSHALPLRKETVPCLGQTLAGPALDGSGLFYDSQTGIVFTKDGYQYSGTNAGQDRNGNQATATADTLDRSTVTTSGGTAPDGMPYTIYTILDSAGSPLQFRVDFQQVTMTTDICSSTGGRYNCTDIPVSADLPSMITLPTGKTYVFKYASNTPGDLIEMDLPTGAIITYQYEDFYQAKYNTSPYYPYPNYVGSRAVTKRTVTVNGQAYSWTYAPSVTSDTVTDPLGNKQVHTFSTVSTGTGGSQVISTNVYETSVAYYNSQGQLLRTVNKTYTADYDPVNNTTANVRVTQTQVVLDTGQTSQVQTDYETFTYNCVNSGGACTGTATRLNPTEVREYDYGPSGQGGTPGPLLRRTDYAYLHTNNPSYVSLNIVDKPTTVTVYDGSGTMVAKTEYEYDNYSHSGLPMQPSGAVQHSSSYGTSFTTRGNVTAVSRWNNVSGSYLTTTNQYDDAGNVISTLDPNGNPTTYSYADSWVNSACVPSGPAAAYRTKITNAKGQSSTTTYYACTGITGSTTDPNGKTTTYGYDSFDRPTSISFPDGGSKDFCYSDDPNGSCYSASALSSRETDAVNATTNLVKTTLYDGLGRVSEMQVNSDPDGTDYVDTQYDGDGRVLRVSNPYRTGDSVYWTTHLYDGIGRSAGVLNQDSSSTSISYTGNLTTSTDEMGNQRKSQTDALGRLTAIWEDPSGLNYETDYQYDTLNDLMRVDQWGGPKGSSGDHVRTFTYDSLDRLLTASNPESGTISYTYDANGNVITKTAPAPNQTGSATVTTTYTYDTLNRLQWKHYNDGVTNATSFGYDGFDALGNPISGLTNVVGRLSNSSAAANRSISDFSYDVMGRVIKKESCIPGDCNYDVKVNATYDLAGDLATLSNGSPTQAITLSYKYDAAERLSSITSSWTGTNHPSTLFEANSTNPASYGPAGLQYALLGGTTSSAATVILSRAYDNRLRPVYEGDTNSADAPLYSYCIQGPNNSHCTSSSSGYAPNGNVQELSDSVMGNWTFQGPGYDSLNRLVNGAATTGPYATKYGCWQYDAFGNRKSEAVSTTPCPQSPTPLSWAHYNTNNQISATGLMPNGDLYDAAGNVVNDGVNQYLYDAEDRLCAVKSDTTGTLTGYIYDGAGDRVGKGTITSFSCNLSSNGFVTTSGYVVGLSGEQLTETNGGTGWVHTHVYANGKLLAAYTSSDTLFELSDWLGTKRADVGVSGCETTWQSLPFGDGLTSSGNCSDSSELHFTGKERDSESGNDYFGARYYASNMGRFLTPDWAAKAVTVPYASFGDPQTLNLYAYVENGPLNRVDADGHMSQPTGYGSRLMNPPCGSTGADMTACDSGGSPFGLDYSAAEANYDAAYVAQVEWVSASTGNKAAQRAQTEITVTVKAKTHFWNRVGHWFGGTSLGIAFARFGRLGGPTHRAVVRRISGMLERDGYKVTQEYYLRTPNGAKRGRFVDVYGERPAPGGGKDIRMFQVGRTNADGQPVPREVQAMNDIEVAPANIDGIRPTFVDYNAPGPFSPTPPPFIEGNIDDIPLEP